MNDVEQGARKVEHCNTWRGKEIWHVLLGLVCESGADGQLIMSQNGRQAWCPPCWCYGAILRHERWHNVYLWGVYVVGCPRRITWNALAAWCSAISLRFRKCTNPQDYASVTCTNTSFVQLLAFLLGRCEEGLNGAGTGMGDCDSAIQAQLHYTCWHNPKSSTLSKLLWMCTEVTDKNIQHSADSIFSCDTRVVCWLHYVVIKFKCSLVWLQVFMDSFSVLVWGECWCQLYFMPVFPFCRFQSRESCRSIY